MSKTGSKWGPLAGLVVLSALFSTSCGAGDHVQIVEARKVTDPAAMADAGEEMRFHGHTAAAHGADAQSGGEQELPFLWDVPEGWTEAETSQFRQVNMVPAGNELAECYLSILPGTAGGVVANINRWRSQMSLEDLSPEEVAALPKMMLLGREATLVDLKGAYKGMGDMALEGWAFLGCVLEAQGVMVFVKMTGPAEVIEAERGGFESFCQSLRPMPSTGVVVDNSGGDLPPAEGGAEDFAFVLPEGWTDAGARSMRAVNLALGSEGQCYVIELGGDAGGLLPNINRWRGEVGLDPIDEVGMAQLQRVPVLGTEVPLFEGVGSYQGMGGPEGEDMMVLGVCVIRDTTSLFVKLVAPASEAAAERTNFLAFLASLEEL